MVLRRFGIHKIGRGGCGFRMNSHSSSVGGGSGGSSGSGSRRRIVGWLISGDVEMMVVLRIL